MSAARNYVNITVPPSEVYDQAFTLPGERINEHLALTPLWDIPSNGWSGQWAITHIPTGALIPALDACVVCTRYAGRRLAALDVDWAQLTRDKDANELAVGDQLHTIRQIASDVMFHCRAEMCEEFQS